MSGFARRVCVFKMSRIGGTIQDTIATGNDASRVSVRKRGRPSFLVLLNARASNPGHSYLRLLRRKCLLPSAPRVRLRTLNRTSYESRNAMTNVPASGNGAWLRYPKERGRLQCGVCPEKRMAKQERRWTRKVSASLMAITSHLPKGWVSERYSCSDSSACLRLRMRCTTPMHSTAPPAIQVKVTPLRPVRGRPEPFLFSMVMGILVEVTFSPS